VFEPAEEVLVNVALALEARVWTPLGMARMMAQRHQFYGCATQVRNCGKRFDFHWKAVHAVRAL
jgi:hypothetical protein